MMTPGLHSSTLPRTAMPLAWWRRSWMATCSYCVRRLRDTHPDSSMGKTRGFMVRRST